ncbi:MAG: hypothetical protein OK474_06300 [Thaumarchaeota archaeon]|nr:hypothetical protein [Nitrososphaerota archaeon]
MSKDPAENDTIKHDEFIFGLVQKRMYDELDRFDKLDSKANSLITLSGVLAGFFLGIITNEFAILSKFPVVDVLLLFVGVGLLIASVAANLVAIRVRRFDLVPDPRALIDGYKSKSYLETLRPVAVEMSSVQEELVKLNNQKAHSVDTAWNLLIGGLGITFIFVIAVFANAWI